MTDRGEPQVNVDNLSSMGRKLLRFGYDQAYRRLVVHGGGNEEVQAIMADLKPADLLGVPVRDANHAAGVLSGLWLWHDWLEESHRIAQAIDTATGSFWHAIMHRREGDFSNSKYWYRRVGDHPIHATLVNHANTILNPLPPDKQLLRLTHQGWNAAVLVDLVEEAHATPDDPRTPVLITLQQLEWRLLFDHCVREAGN